MASEDLKSSPFFALAMGQFDKYESRCNFDKALPDNCNCLPKQETLNAKIVASLSSAFKKNGGKDGPASFFKKCPVVVLCARGVSSAQPSKA